MAPTARWPSFLLAFIALVAAGGGTSTFSGSPKCWPEAPVIAVPVFKTDVDRLQFPLNLEFLEAEFFLISALGFGLDRVAPQLALGGPPPVGGRKANLDPATRCIIEEFAYQEVGHLRAIQKTVGGFPRPLLNLSAASFAAVFDAAMGYRLEPPFDPYANSLNYWLASYVIPYVGLVGYVGASPNINGFVAKRLLAGLLGVESGQDAVIRAKLYERGEETVEPYKRTVAEFTAKISELRNRLAGCGVKDEGIFVPLWLGAENRTHSNVLSADFDSLSYPRLPVEILKIVYSTGDASKPGGFYPEGGNGKIARSFLRGH